MFNIKFVSWSTTGLIIPFVSFQMFFLSQRVAAQNLPSNSITDIKAHICKVNSGLPGCPPLSCPPDCLQESTPGLTSNSQRRVPNNWRSVAYLKGQRDVSPKEITVRINAFDSTDQLVATETLQRDRNTRTIDMTYRYLINGKWEQYVIKNVQNQQLRRTGSLQPGKLPLFRLRREEIANAKFRIDSGGGATAGPVGCFVGVATATFGCGGFAAIPFAGWGACAVLAAGAFCPCFEDNVEAC